jgi:hypothetical protein
MCSYCKRPDENTCNVRIKTLPTLATSLKQMKYLEPTLETYVYSYCNIPIYFYNIDTKHLQHTLKHLKYLKHIVVICAFQRKHLLAASANGGSLTCGGHRCARWGHGARRQHGAGQRHTTVGWGQLRWRRCIGRVGDA